MRLFVRDSIDATSRPHRWAKPSSPSPSPPAKHTMPSYTHLQRAEPVLVAHWLLAYVSMIERDLSRLTDARTRMNFCPLGSGAVAGATLALDRTIAASALAFTAPTPNSMDATSDRDFMLDFAQAASTLGLHISRFAEELTLYATAEFGFVDLPEAFSTGSSAMPQKKNPDLTELARGKSARLLGAATALATLIKGLPLAYNKDLQEGQEQIFDIADTLAGLLSVLPNFTRSLKFRFPAWKPPQPPATSTPWPPPPTSPTRAFPSAPPTRSSATPSASAGNPPRTQRPHPRRTPNPLARLRRRLLRRHHPPRHARLPRRPRRHQHRARRRSPRRREARL
jgi:argininosuccinate lyase